MPPLFADAMRNAAVDAFVDLMNAHTLKFFDGTMPADLATADAGTLLVTLTLANPAFGDAAAGVATAAAITSQDAVTTGTMKYWREYSGTTCKGQGLIATAFDLSSWVKVSDHEATATLPDGHGLTTGAGFLVLWTGGGRAECLATISGNSITLKGGYGYAFPASATAGVVVGQGDLLVDSVEVSSDTNVAVDLLTVEHPED